ncbi:MAG: hypothetical protein MJZ05_04800 [Fibrobacter sp.]|nr:hypothetical protein [Fibrobacter sp.]
MIFEKNILYIWVGGSCDYGHKERAGGGAYIAQTFESESKDSAKAKTIDTYTCAEFDTTEFKMIFKAMNHALEKVGSASNSNSELAVSLPTFSKIIFLSNVQYILNFEKPDNVEVKILPYHKFDQQKEVHDMASNAMRELRKNPN